jgi:hypothetical protein
MRITFKSFDSKLASREKLFKAAVDFANKVDPQKLITITHSEDRDNIVITIWYWTDEADKTAEIKAKQAADMAKINPTGALPATGLDVPAPPRPAASPVAPPAVPAPARTSSPDPVPRSSKDTRQTSPLRETRAPLGDVPHPDDPPSEED